MARLSLSRPLCVQSMVGRRMRSRVAAALPGAQDVPITADLEATDSPVVLDYLDQNGLPYVGVPVGMIEVRKDQIQLLPQVWGVVK